MDMLEKCCLQNSENIIVKSKSLAEWRDISTGNVKFVTPYTHNVLIYWQQKKQNKTSINDCIHTTFGCAKLVWNLFAGAFCMNTWSTTITQ